MARIADFLSSEGLAEGGEQHLLLEQFLRSSDHGWVESHDGELWYLFEDTRRHPFLTASRKVLSAVESRDPRALAEACRRYLAHREGTEKYSHEIAPDALIQSYLTTSTTFDLVNGRVRFRRPRSSNLTPRETALVEHLGTAPGGSSRGEVKAYLETLDYKVDSTLDKDLRYSPFVQVDKQGGEGNHRYFLIGNRPDEPASAAETWDQRYERFRDELARLNETDFSSSSRPRLDQPILRRWLFEGKEKLDCALCGNRFVLPNGHEVHGDRRTSPLVAAHKKKRANCTEAERRDPYIVMPLCQFGCDFVYEHRYVTIRDGVIVRGRHREEEDAVADYVSKLLEGDRRVADEWTKGCNSYFDDA